MSARVRNPIEVTLSVWRAMFLREALDRLFDMRGAWFWLLFEPVMHIGFIAVIWTVIRMHTAGGIDYAVWIIVGMLAFFLFRRTAMQVMHAPDSNRPLFAYRQVKPFDTAIVRAILEAFLMSLISMIVLSVAALLGHVPLPNDPLRAMAAALGLWLFGLGYGVIASVLMELVPETKHILMILMLPLYLISGVIWPLVNVPLPYRDVLMLNPIAHGLEEVRMGFAPYYHAVPGVSLSYLYAIALISVFIGLLLYRRYSLRLVMQ